jgi:hypothetical protein
MQRAVGATIEPGSFVELRGGPWLVEEVQGEANDLQTLNLSCISDDAQVSLVWNGVHAVIFFLHAERACADQSGNSLRQHRLRVQQESAAASAYG